MNDQVYPVFHGVPRVYPGARIPCVPPSPVFLNTGTAGYTGKPAESEARGRFQSQNRLGVHSNGPGVARVRAPGEPRPTPLETRCVIGMALAEGPKNKTIVVSVLREATLAPLRAPERAVTARETP